jgi:drug/metabolite transporter (DMT)-like permease
LAPFTYAHVVAAIIYSFVIFKDVPSIWTLTGAALIVGSGIYVWYRETMIARTARRP